LRKDQSLYLSYLKILGDLIHPSGTKTVDSFLEESIHKINFHIFLQGVINFDRSTKDKGDFMDIDNIESYGYKNNKTKLLLPVQNFWTYYR